LIIEINKEEATGLGLALGKKVSTHESCARMAWLAMLAAYLDDRPEWFPCGQMRTLERIQEQLEIAAETKAAKLLQARK